MTEKLLFNRCGKCHYWYKAFNSSIFGRFGHCDRLTIDGVPMGLTYHACGCAYFEKRDMKDKMVIDTLKEMRDEIFLSGKEKRLSDGDYTRLEALEIAIDIVEKNI